MSTIIDINDCSYYNSYYMFSIKDLVLENIKKVDKLSYKIIINSYIRYEKADSIKPLYVFLHGTFVYLLKILMMMGINIYHWVILVKKIET